MPRIAEYFGGPHWNEDVVSVILESRRSLDADTISDLGRLRRLCVLQIHDAGVSDANVEALLEMRQLQWLLLATEMDAESAIRLRDGLSHTFVTHIGP